MLRPGMNMGGLPMECCHCKGKFPRREVIKLDGGWLPHYSCGDCYHLPAPPPVTENPWKDKDEKQN